MTESQTASASIQLPKKSFTTEFYVGLFALIGVACFAYLSINLVGMKILERGLYKVIAKFNNISGVDIGAPVMLAGVKIGEVSNIELLGTVASVTLSIKSVVSLRDDDIAAIRTKGIIGDRYIKIIPGASSDFIKDGGDISDTESVVELEEIIGKFIHKM